MHIAAANPTYVQPRRGPGRRPRARDATSTASQVKDKPAQVDRQDRRGQAGELLRAVLPDGPGLAIR